eukprot:875594-Pelagomonas_calceolata.AAC.5
MVHMVVQMRENEVKKIANCPSRPLLTCSPVQFKQAMHPEKEEQEGTLESLAAHCIIYIDRVSTGIVKLIWRTGNINFPIDKLPDRGIYI